MSYNSNQMTYPSIPVMGYRVYSKTTEELKFTHKKTIINTLNAYSYVMANRDNSFKEALQSSDILIADGFPVVLAARFLGDHKITKIAGNDIYLFLLDYLNKKSGTCFFLGSSEQTLDKIRIRLGKEYPSVKVKTFSPPFKKKFSSDDNQRMISEINAFSPEVLFVGMTAPKQEKWVFENKESIDARIICSIGAVFDFYAGTVERPSDFWISLNLEWFARFLKEPRRLWKRYFIYSPIFFRDLLFYRLKIKSSAD